MAGSDEIFTSDIRSVRKSARSIASLSGAFPEFVHKWTRVKRAYSFEDVSIPRRLFLSGAKPDWSRPVIAIGGTRSPTAGTFCLVADLVRQLTKLNAVVLSGGVPGVDVAAHLACLDQQGSTYAVLANPVDLGLAAHEWASTFISNAIRDRGGFISEYENECPIWSAEYLERLLARDRIISGLCDLLIVFECNRDSATIDTVRRALVQGKMVVGIDSKQKSSRRGIEKLPEFGLQVYSEDEHTRQDLAEILAGLIRL